MILFIPAATQKSADNVGWYFEQGKLKPAPYNLTQSLCQDHIDRMPNGGRTLNIAYRPWPVEVDLKELVT